MRSAPTCASRTTSAAACRTTAAGAVRARRAAATASSIRIGIASAAATASTLRTISPTGRSRTRSRRMAPPIGAICAPAERTASSPAGRSNSIRPRGPGQPGRGAGAPAGETPDPAAQAAAQFGFGGNQNPNVVPTPPSGTFYRFYWNTPFILSPHNSRTVYLGGDRLFRSFDRGDTWVASPDLTKNIGRNDRPILGIAGTAPMASKHDGAASFSNIVTIGESPLVPGIIWVGTNDGNLQVSRDNGNTWQSMIDNVPGVPKETHVSRVEPSHYDAGTCYVTFDAHRTDDHKPYVFKTTDFGETWSPLASDLPEGNVNVIREDPRSRNLLYLGTEYGFYVSLNGGQE